MVMRRLWPLLCLITFHSPDGQLLTVEAKHVIAVRPAPSSEHVAAGTKSILYVGGQKFGITETPAEAEIMINDCPEEAK
jgi:hypothetical protein